MKCICQRSVGRDSSRRRDPRSFVRDARETAPERGRPSIREVWASGTLPRGRSSRLGKSADTCFDKRSVNR
jgi:hypothetical protein